MSAFPIPACHPGANARGSAFTLVEVTLALGIAVFCLVSVFGLLNVGIATNSASFEQTAATSILSSVVSDLRTAPNTFPKGSAAANTIVYKLTVPACVGSGASPAVSSLPAVYLDAGGQPVASATQARYRLDTWMKPGVGRGATLARVVVSWPPQAVIPAGTVETLVALDRN